MKKVYICIIILVLVVVMINSPYLEGFEDPMKMLEKENRSFPYRYFQDENGKTLPIVAVTGFFREDKQKNLYYDYIKHFKIIGITAYKSFPNKITDPSEDRYHLSDNFNYTKEIKNWLSCLKGHKANIFTKENNLIDISESDLYDVDTQPTPEKKYDFIYICNKDADNCPKEGWNAINRNYKLAEACFPILFNDYKLKGLVVGRVGCKLEELYGDRVETTDFLNWFELQDKMRQSKFLFVPNIYDASPRVIGECLSKGLAVLMSENIVCGSKYVTPETGELFNDEYNIKAALDLLLPRLDKLDVKKWWKEHYGVEKTAIKLRNFLYQYYPDILKDVKQVKFIL